jgi:precorrin-2 dehydrogenase / sirohydrochlorin ferrochelatase
MKVYPIFLNDLCRRRCVVIGGGHEAEQKVAGLLACDAQVTLIAGTVTESLATWESENRFNRLARDYQPGDLKGAFLVISEKGSPERNAQVWQEATAEGALVNVMDDVQSCNFVAGSVVRQGPLAVAISTSGAAPTLAVRLRERLQAELGPEYKEFLDLMAALREPMMIRYPTFGKRRHLWYQLVDSDILSRLRDGRHDLAYERAAAIVGQDVVNEARRRGYDAG